MIQMLNGVPGMDNAEGMKLKFEKVEVSIDESGKKVEFEKTTDAGTRKIVGVAINGTNDASVDASTLNLNINALEIFPRDFEAKMLRTGQEVAPNQKYFIFHKAIEVDRDEIRGWYQDGGAYTTPYKVTIYFLAFEE